MRYFVLLFLVILTAEASAQSKEEVAKSVMTSFKKKSTDFTKYFVSTEQLLKVLEKEKWFREIDSAVAEGSMSWEEMSLDAGFDSAASTKEEYMTMLRDHGKRELIKNWKTLIDRHYSCYGSSADTLNVKLVKEKQGLEEVFLVVSGGKNKFAIRLFLYDDGDNVYIGDVSSTIRLLDKKGKYTCQAQCTNGKGVAFICY